MTNLSSLVCYNTKNTREITNMANIIDIIGYKKDVEKLKSICDFLKNTDKYLDFDVDLPNGLLICGQFGVGKTFMAEALIEDSERESFYFKGNGYNVRRLKHIFKKAKKVAYSIIFIDDIDYLTSNDDCPVYSQLVREINDCDNGEVFVIATASRKDTVI